MPYYLSFIVLNFVKYLKPNKISLPQYRSFHKHSAKTFESNLLYSCNLDGVCGIHMEWFEMVYWSILNHRTCCQEMISSQFTIGIRQCNIALPYGTERGSVNHVYFSINQKTYFASVLFCKTKRVSVTVGCH